MSACLDVEVFREVAVEVVLEVDVEVELGFTVDQTIQEVERCLNCDIQTVFADDLCIECDACIDICPVNCLTITLNGDEAELRERGATRERRTKVSRKRNC